MQTSNECLEDISGGNNGEYWISSTDGAVTGKNIRTIVVADDAVFTVLNGKDKTNATVNYLTTFNLTGKTVTQMQFIKAPEGCVFTEITLSSGTVRCINK